jgi:hypothetical protein
MQYIHFPQRAISISIAILHCCFHVYSGRSGAGLPYPSVTSMKLQNIDVDSKYSSNLGSSSRATIPFDDYQGHSFVGVQHIFFSVQKVISSHDEQDSPSSTTRFFRISLCL